MMTLHPPHHLTGAGRNLFPATRPSASRHLISEATRVLSLVAAAVMGVASSVVVAAGPQGDVSAAYIPEAAPRTLVPAGRADAFRAYVSTGEGAAAFAKIKADFDRDYLTLAFPAEPVTYGDPEPKKRTSDKADHWRAAQDTCGLVGGVAEAAALLWAATGEERYLAKAKQFLLGASSWHFAPDWRGGAVPGATDIYYNDEAHFRLWRKLPLAYDLIRDQFTPDEKSRIVGHFRTRGERSVQWIKEANIEKLRRNSLVVAPESHPVRFMAMTGLAGLALWDDLPEAHEWWRFAYSFYRDQFSPWGGDAGGWAEGNAYWRGTIEHAAFQDALLAIGDPLAYASPFWRNSPYFAVYNVQPYLHTAFGDSSNAGRFNLESSTADYLEHLARVLGDGHLLTYAALCIDTRPRPAEKGLGKLDRIYPTAAEFLIRNFTASARPRPAPASLDALPPHRHFSDVGWVSLHSALGRPADDIHVTFVSSPYGSFSHSHGHQNAFILNAYGESLAINSAYREFHRSPLHREWTWQTKSKNALLIDGLGQRPQDKTATGRITRFETTSRYVWTTGDATVAYQTLQPAGRVKRVTRDLVFIDQRYVVLRDRVELATPGKLSWLLHAEEPIVWDDGSSTAIIRRNKVTLTSKLLSPGVTWTTSVTDQFPVPIDPKYTAGMASYVTARWTPQSHFTAESNERAASFTVFAVLWPERDGVPATALDAHIDQTTTLVVQRPDGQIDSLTLTDDRLTVR